MNGFLEHSLCAKREKTPPPVPKVYKPTPYEIVKEWWDQQPDEVKQRSYLTMHFFMRDFDTAPGTMGKILYELGFKKARICPNDGPHQRVWIPPEM
ncbi:hypothetical protein [Trichlorobacter lovleyi]|uniref:Uncharacterized protein n=1 Tax=Trichlorobacter lovleyi (strain ATCC BAA-1151 / DSM 17278 / SZ) TaxID=398767 RepID=B3E9U5_TRIL1|nr:hypothetical protein [Trichlorobacter lovleyi]ACD96820.1 hypothetical protein Glov_3114 [Trichlorobacter lovleyi SZ]